MKKNYSREEILSQIYAYLRDECDVIQELSDKTRFASLYMDSLDQIFFLTGIEGVFDLKHEFGKQWYEKDNFLAFTIGDLADEVMKLS